MIVLVFSALPENSSELSHFFVNIELESNTNFTLTCFGSGPCSLCPDRDRFVKRNTEVSQLSPINSYNLKTIFELRNVSSKTIYCKIFLNNEENEK